MSSSTLDKNQSNLDIEDNFVVACQTRKPFQTLAVLFADLLNVDRRVFVARLLIF